MIRIFTLFCKLNKISLSEHEWIEHSITKLQVWKLSCPCCGSKSGQVRFATYKRYLVSLVKNRMSTLELVIPRTYCSSCRHTHALLPECLIPHGSYGLLTILHILREYFLRTRTVEEICKEYGISHSTLYSWIKQLKASKRRWLGILCDSEQKTIAFLETLSTDVLFQYCETFRQSFMQKTADTYFVGSYAWETKGSFT